MCGIVFVLQVVYNHTEKNREDHNVKPPSINTIEVGEEEERIGTEEKNEWDFLSLDILKLNEANAKRGPDVSGYRVETLTLGDKKIKLHFWGHVLHLRGKLPTQQPLYKNQDVLLWNAEVFGGLQVKTDENDGILVLELLSKATTKLEIISIIDGLDGPHGFVFYKASLQKIFFGRDKLGIRSLLSTNSTSDSISCLTLASVGSYEQDNQTEWTELETRYLYSIDLKDLSCSVDVDWTNQITSILRPSSMIDPVLNLPNYLVISQVLETFFDPLTPVKADFDTIFSAYMKDSKISEAVSKLLEVLSQSVLKRVESIPLTTCPENARLGVLFSGGIDCTILALLAHTCLPLEEPIDLLNVSFENLRIATVNALKGLPPPPAPDRITGLAGVEELRRLCPGRQFRFVAIDIPYDEAIAARPYLQSLLKPSCTEMDLSIAMAFWFASKGSGKVDNVAFQSRAKVLLSGLGADEQLAGYSRHRSAFERGGWPTLLEEVQLDVGRISQRNLGRDDRMVGDNGREVRYPYLDSRVISFLSSLPLPLKVNFAYPRGIGEKILLRLLARKLGFDSVAGLPKRAIQFGARTAKMSPGSSAKLGHHKLE